MEGSDVGQRGLIFRKRMPPHEFIDAMRALVIVFDHELRITLSEPRSHSSFILSIAERPLRSISARLSQPSSLPSSTQRLCYKSLSPGRSNASAQISA